MKRVIFLFSLLYSLPIVVTAQQLPIFTQYRDYYGYVNPASVSIDYFGSDGDSFYAFGVSHRRQWVNSAFPSILTSVGRGEVFINQGGNISFLAGGYFMSDNVGVTSFDAIYGRGAIYIGDPNENFWGLGVNVGAVNHSIQVSSQFKDVARQDRAINDASTLIPDIGVGLFGVYELNNLKLFGGVSAPQLFSFNLELETDNGGKFSYDRIYHLYNYGGFYINTSRSRDDYSFIEVSFWGKYVPGSRYHTDLNFRYQITSPFWIGVGAASTKNLHLETGFNIPLNVGYMKIGYGYDTSFNVGYGSHTGSSHELNVSVILEKG